MRMDDVQHGVNEYEVTLSREFSCWFFSSSSALSQLYATNCKLQTQLRARDDEACQRSKKKKSYTETFHMAWYT